jgi:hypothetical protein
MLIEREIWARIESNQKGPKGTKRDQKGPKGTKTAAIILMKLVVRFG